MLTEREIEVLDLKTKGHTQVEIATKIKISQPAVSSFYNNAMKKIKESKEVLEIAKKIGVKLR